MSSKPSLLPIAATAQVRTQKNEAFLVLERMIVNGELAPGAWVSETELTDLTGLTRAPVRSAIERLSEQQLISVFPRRGAQVCPIDFTLQFRALELRRAVERLLVASAASRASNEQRAQFQVLSNRFTEIVGNGDQAMMTRVDFDTFGLVLEAADNPFAAKAMMSVKGLSRRFWILYQEQHGDACVMAEHYAQLTAAIAKASPSEAARAVDRLIDYVEAFTLRVIGYSGRVPASMPQEES